MAARRPRPRLARIALDAPLPALPFYLVMRQDLRAVPRGRAVADALLAVLAEEVARQEQPEERFSWRA